MATSDLKTVVGLFDDLTEARSAVQELSNEGFSQNDVSLIAHASTEEYNRYFDKEGRYTATANDVAATDTGSATMSGAGIGATLGGLGGLLLGMSLLPIPGIGPIVAAGPITSALVGAVAGGVLGGLLGALTHMGVPEDHASYYSEGVRRGGTLVIVKTIAGQIDRATQILNRHAPVDVQQRVSFWKQSGWNGYDPAAPAYTPDLIANERRTYGAAGGAVGGAATGAAIGSVVPGVGTAAGAVVGGVAGGAGAARGPAAPGHPVGTAAGAVGGAATGAAIGSVVPGIGTAAGAVVGGLAGAAGGHEVAKETNPRPDDRL